MTTLQKQENKTHERLVKTDEDRIKKEIELDDNFIIRAKRIKVSPLNIISKKTINDAIAISRKIWNCCVTEVHRIDNSKEEKITLNGLRDKFVTRKNMSNKQIKSMNWTFRIQQKVREAVVQKFLANYKTAKSNFTKSQYKYIYKQKVKKGKSKQVKKKKKITMQFRNKEDEKQVIYLNKEICKFSINASGQTILKTFNDVLLVLDEPYNNFNTETKCDNCQLICADVTRLQKHLARKTKCEEMETVNTGIPHAEMILQRVGYDYYLYIPEYKNVKIKSEASKDIVAIDAGWKTLLTYFSPDGEWGEICPGIKDRILDLHKKINKISKYTNLSKYTIKKAIGKRKRYIINMMDDLHWKICHWLLSKFRKIIISRLYVARSNKEGKRIQADLRLCSFVDRLVQKSIEYKNSEIHVCKEHYTSQACTKCLSLHTKKDVTVRCEVCKNVTHRDLNGARNIFLKHCY